MSEELQKVTCDKCHLVFHKVAGQTTICPRCNKSSATSGSSKRTRTIAIAGAFISLTGIMFTLGKMGMVMDEADGSLTRLMVIFASLLFTFALFVAVVYQFNLVKFIVGLCTLFGVIAFGGAVGVIWDKQSNLGGSVLANGALPQPLAILLSLFIFAICVCFYFVPAIVAYHRRKKDWVAIGVLNLLLGWTFVGWVIALVWALKND